MKEDGTLTTAGQLTKSDIDTNDTHTWSIANSGNGQYGKFTLDQTGKWTYTLDNASAKVQALAEGQTVTDTITVTVNDGKGGTATQEVTVTITGTNDIAKITGQSTGAVIEDNTLLSSGKLTVSDADAGQSSVVAQTNAAGKYGTLDRCQWQLDLFAEQQLAGGAGSETRSGGQGNLRSRFRRRFGQADHHDRRGGHQRRAGGR